MKTITTFLFLIPAALFAQQTIDVSFSTISQSPNCPTPVNENMYVYGHMTGLAPATDSVDAHINFGDGNDTLKRVPVYAYTSVEQYFYVQINHSYSIPGIYSITMAGTTPDGTNDSIHFTNSLIVTNTCDNLTGRVYRDNNSNCIYDAGDDPIYFQDVLIREQNASSGLHVYTDAAGYYHASVLTGETYAVSAQFNLPNVPFGCSQTDTVLLTSAGNDVVDFPLGTGAVVDAAMLTDSVGTHCYGNGLVFLSGYAYYYGAISASTMDIYVAFGDGHDTTFSTGLFSSSDNFKSTNVWMQHYYAAPGNYSILFAVTEPSSGATDTLISYNEVILSDSCGNISGNIYNDLNNSCAWDAGDNALPYAYVYLYQNNQYVTADWAGPTGGYSFDVPAGSYTVSLGNYVNTYGYTMACSTSANRAVTIAPFGSATEDFGLNCNSNMSDAAVHLSGWGTRPGQTAYLYPSLTSLTCIPQSGTITVVLDPQTTFAGTCDTSLQVTVAGNTVSWPYTNITPYSYYSNWTTLFGCLMINVDSSAVIGDSLCFTVYISPSVTDANSSNDTVHYCLPVRNSWDPNMKEVSPAGPAANGHVAPNTEMTYTIHFQNTGNDVAYNIAVMDTLDPSLDVSTLQILGSSHTVEPDMIGNNVMRFNFNNINLPDSASNEPMSHGWVTYKITQNQWLPSGTVFDNTAYIYFDFNPAIVTNTTSSIVDWALTINELETGNGIQTFPVPADNFITVSSEKTLSGTIVLRDISGREIRTQAIDGKDAQIATGDLSEGIYILTITSDGKTISRKVMISH